jgi:S1-C subfamily serine protease
VPTYLPAVGQVAGLATTDARGRFRLGELEEGTITLEAYAPDVGRARETGIQVSAGRRTGGVVIHLVGDGERASEPTASGGVAVTLGDVSGDPPEVVLVAVVDGSEAERAGLAQGDTILEVDGARVHTIGEARARLSGPLAQDVVVTRRRGDAVDALRVPREPVRR